MIFSAILMSMFYILWLAQSRLELPKTRSGVFQGLLLFSLLVLVSGEIDVGVLILSNLEDRHALQTEVLTHSPHRLWLPARHPLLERDSISLADVASGPADPAQRRRNGPAYRASGAAPA